MCYAVVVVKDKCNQVHPHRETSEVCLRPCQIQAAKSKEVDIWNRAGQDCGRLEHDARVLITDGAEPTVSAKDCHVCVAQQALEDEIYKHAEDKRKLKLKETDLVTFLEELQRQNAPQDDPGVLGFESQLRDTQQAIAKSVNTIKKLEGRIDARTAEIVAENEQEVKRYADARSGALHELFYYVKDRVSRREMMSRIAVQKRDYPRDFPDETAAHWRKVDRYGILTIPAVGQGHDDEESDEDDEEGEEIIIGYDPGESLIIRDGDDGSDIEDDTAVAEQR